MDKIWYRNTSKSEVIGRCGGDENNEWPRRTDKKSNVKKNMGKNIHDQYKTDTTNTKQINIGFELKQR